MMHDENIVVLLLLFHKDSGDYKNGRLYLKLLNKTFILSALVFKIGKKEFLQKALDIQRNDVL